VTHEKYENETKVICLNNEMPLLWELLLWKKY